MSQVMTLVQVLLYQRSVMTRKMASRLASSQVYQVTRSRHQVNIGGVDGVAPSLRTKLLAASLRVSL